MDDTTCMMSAVPCTASLTSELPLLKEERVGPMRVTGRYLKQLGNKLG